MRNRKKESEILTGTVSRVEFPDFGIVTVGEKEYFIRYAVKGQTINFRPAKRRKGHQEGTLLEIVERAPMETPKTACPHCEVCGSCMYGTFPQEEENAIKEEQLRHILRRFVPAELFEGVKEPPEREEYRNKMEFSFGDEYKDGPLALGFHKRGSHYDILNVDHCRMVDADYRMILTAVRTYFAEKKTPYVKKNTHEGYLRHLLVRKAKATGQILVDLVTAAAEPVMTKEEERELIDGFVKVLLDLPIKGSFAGILHTSNDSLADIIRNDGTEILYGTDHFVEKLLGLSFTITPFSFFQTNSKGAEVLYSVAREYVGDTNNKVIYDLYSGTGTIAQILAPVAKKVVGVEIVPEAVDAARINAAGNGLTNCEFIAGDVLKVLDDLTEKPDIIVLDPPREGIHPKALPKIVNYGVDHLIYISCKPTSLARDLEYFTATGYRVERVCGVNMFCFSANVETVCLLTRVSE